MSRGSTLIVLCLATATLSADSRLPAALAPLTSFISLTPQEVDALTSGRAVTRTFGNEDGELRLFGAIWIDGMETGAPRVVATSGTLDEPDRERRHRISDPPRETDFAALTIPAEDVAGLRDCRRGDCALKVTDAMLQRVRAIDWSAPAADAQAVMRNMALSVVTGYRNGGDSALGELIDDSQSISIAQQTAAIVREIPLLDSGLRQYLLSYPHATLPGATSSFSWQIARFGLKPTFRINHVVTVTQPDRSIIVSKQLYASHYIRAAIDVQEFIPDPSRGHGHWLVEVSIARVDGLTGIRGHFIRQRASSQGTARLARALQTAKARLESTAAHPTN